MITDLLCKIFIKNYNDTQNPRVRGRYGTLAAVVGIIVNVLLFAGKFIIGTLTSSIAITADAINNLSDAGSSVISFISFRISAKPADREHPFGHARIEYIASMVVSFLIVHIGIDLLGESLDKILHGGDKTDPSIAAITVLSASIIAKLLLFLFNRRLGGKINSAVMKATAADSLSDAVSTSAVLVATVVYRLFDIELDAYMGILVAIFILRSGIEIFKEAMNSIIGAAPDKELVDNIKKIVFNHPEALGIHDLAVHGYGPGCSFASMHIEVDGSKDIYDSHDAIDNMEKELYTKLGIHCVLHLDPIAVGDDMTSNLRTMTERLAREVSRDASVHDFRIVPGATHTNLIFDIALPFEEKRSNDEVANLLRDKIASEDPKYIAVISVDRQ